MLDEDYQGVRTGLASTDVASIQALYGTRKADAFEVGGNATTSAAKALPATAPDTMVARADITKSGDVDYFKFTTPDQTSMAGGVTVNFRSAGLSLLAADVTVLDDKGNTIASASSNGTPGVFLTLSPSMVSQKTYFVAIKASAGSNFNVGAYKLSVLFTKANATPPVDPAGVVSAPTYTNDGGTNETLATATTLQAISGTTSQAHYAQFAQLLSSTDVDVYKVQAPVTPTGTTNMLVSVTSMSFGQQPVVQFYAANGTLLAAELVSATSSGAVYQIRNVTSGSILGVRVASAGWFGASKYNLQVDFLAKAIDLTTTGSGTISATAPAQFHTLIINQPQVISFNLLTETDGASSPGYLWVQIFDKSGNTISTWSTQPGGLSSKSLLLEPGEYTIKISAWFFATSADIDYSLRLDTVTDPIGLAIADPTMSTTVGNPTAPAPASPTVTPTTPATAPPAPFQFYTYDPSYYAWLLTPL